MSRITRHYANIDGRQVHYRMAGKGMPLLMLHQSPRSSYEFVPIIDEWRQQFCVIAPDTPGNGHSDPLMRTSSDAPPSMDDFAHALAQFMDAIGLRKAAFFGYHTGAALALAFASLYPERVAHIALNGFAVMQDDELAEILEHYLPSFAPDWSGQHLAWMWARYREQVLFFPWFATREAARMPYDMSDDAKMNDQIMDQLWADDAYRHPYRAAFAFDKQQVMDKIKAPVTIMAAPPDPLVEHLDRIGDLPDNITIERPADAQALLNRACEIFASCTLDDFTPSADASAVDTRAVDTRAVDTRAIDASPDDASAGAASTSQMRRIYLGDATDLHSRMNVITSGDGGNNNSHIVLLHDVLQNGACLADDAAWLIQNGKTVLLPDLPAHGLSLADHADNLEAAVDFLSTRLASMAVSHIVGYGFSAVLAARLAERLAPSIETIASIAAIAVDAIYPQKMDAWAARFIPDLAITPHGGHLLEGWRMVRGGSLFYPWFSEKRDCIIPINEHLQARAVHRRFIALMEAYPHGRALTRDLMNHAPKTSDKMKHIYPAWVQSRPDLAPLASISESIFYDSTRIANRAQAILDAL